MLTLTLAALPLVAAGAAPLGSHTWRVNEVFSNADGTVQFIELRECCGGANEINVGNKDVTSAASAFTIPANVPAGTTANAHILLGTATFAALPGAPTPDHIIPDNFFDTDTDSLQWHIYAPSVLSFTSGQLPTDGLNSLDQSGTSAPNSPTNFAGQTGQVDLSVVASSTPRNGIGCNPTTFTELTPPVLGTTWSTNIAFGAGDIASILKIGLGGPVATGCFNGLLQGQILILEPTLPDNVSVTGAHNFPLPNDVRLIGVPIWSQGFTFQPGQITLYNAIDSVLGV